jgi:hypothetical protein
LGTIMTCLPLVSFPPVKLFVMIRNITFTYYSAGRNTPEYALVVMVRTAASTYYSAGPPKTGRFVATNLHPASSKPGAYRVIEVP